MDMLENVLCSVQSGVTRFEPASDSEDDIRHFQATANALVHAQERGYVRGCKPRTDSTTGMRRYDLVLILGSITYPGQQYLDEIDRRNRTIPDMLSDTIYGLPPSGDEKADELLRAAIELFRKHDPTSRRSAVEKLWDAWERLKTLPDEEPDKGNKILLNLAAGEVRFRDLLANEADCLHKVGNEFHIRHFKTESIEITRIEHYDYLFHRLIALLNLLLVSLQKK